MLSATHLEQEEAAHTARNLLEDFAAEATSSFMLLLFCWLDNYENGCMLPLCLMCCLHRVNTTLIQDRVVLVAWSPESSKVTLLSSFPRVSLLVPWSLESAKATEEASVAKRV